MSEKPVKKSNKTLIIILAVLGLLCLVCGGVAVSCGMFLKPIAETTTSGMSLQLEVNAAINENAAAGTSAETLRAAILARGNITEDGLKDSWGRPFRFEKQGESWIVVSDGMDETTGTEDDMRFSSDGTGVTSGGEGN